MSMDRGSGDGFADFAQAQAQPLLGLAHALTANPHDAWDLTQETLARIGERWGRTRFDEPAAYARTVMVRLNIDRLRRLRRELPLLHRADQAAPVAVVGEPDGWLIEALRTLTPRQRTSLALRYVEDLDVRAIAERDDPRPLAPKSQCIPPFTRDQSDPIDHHAARLRSGRRRKVTQAQGLNG